MQYTLDQLYRHLCQKVDDTYLVFQNFFGKEYTDLQMYRHPTAVGQLIRSKLSLNGIVGNIDTGTGEEVFEVSDQQLKTVVGTVSVGKAIIYVWWPSVVVTNEHNKSVVIQDLYAKIEINHDGTIPYECPGFLLNRATYTKIQFLSDYMHSHIQGINKTNFSHFLSPCLGTGPIRETIASLKNESDEVTWMLFCQELADYVTVESLHGGPWRRLEEIGRRDNVELTPSYNYTNTNMTSFLTLFTKESLKSFVQYYLQYGHLTLGFQNSKFTCNMPYTDFVVDISNAFIDFYNLYLKSTESCKEACFNKTLLRNVEIRNGLIYYTQFCYNSTPTTNVNYYRGKYVLTFKGKDITTTIIESTNPEEEIESVTIIDPSLAMYILAHILKIINYRYKNEYKHRTDKEPAFTYQRVFYL